MEFIKTETEFQIEHNNERIIEHSSLNPFLYVGYGEESVEMFRGNFKIEDYVVERYPIVDFEIKKNEKEEQVLITKDLSIRIKIKDEQAILKFEKHNSKINRIWIRLCGDEKEKIYGCGEQMSYLNLRGRNFPLWTSEPGVGRDKSTYITWLADQQGRAGGDYYNTNYPQTTFISSRHYYFHAETTAYADFNFKNKSFHELQFWEVPKEIRIESAENYVELLEKLTSYLGRQPELPEWVYNGLIIGVQGGTKRAFEILDNTLKKDINVSGLWCQDWEGKKITSFGKRLFWDWKWDSDMYPNLQEKLEDLKKANIKFLGYINPYLVSEGTLYKEGEEKGYFAKSERGEKYLVDFGEFDCGVVDLTNPKAYEWFKEIIKKNLIQFGLDGWMADFGEYLPIDVKLFNGESPMIEHNKWPVLWAKCNYEALKETGKLGDVLYFMRAGGAGSQKYCTLLWAGDQSVDFSIHDGLASVICGALSAGMSGFGLSHSDIGGYTSLFGNIRSKELFLRWAEMAAFTPVMRTHEGNRPDDNFQYYDDEDTMNQLSRLTKIYVELALYIKELVKENSEKGIPVQRPLFLHYEKDENTYEIQYEYLLGEDLLVSPVYQADIKEWKVYLPEDEWVHLWTGEEYTGGNIIINAEIGYPPVFYKKSSNYISIFRTIQEKYGSSIAKNGN